MQVLIIKEKGNDGLEKRKTTYREEEGRGERRGRRETEGNMMKLDPNIREIMA